MPPSGLDALDPSGGIALFTDGSSWTKDGSGGWAWLAFGVAEGEAWDSGGESGTTNNRMEMQAWIQGLNALYDALGSLEILVYSDSEYVGLGAMNRLRARRKNMDLWRELDAAIDRHVYVKFMHVRGHTGHEYNERVDKLASEARVRHQDMTTVEFDGATYDPGQDHDRLCSQLERVFATLCEGSWYTLAEIAELHQQRHGVTDSEAAISARIRDFRKERFGSWDVQARRRDGGLWEYCLA